MTEVTRKVTVITDSTADLPDVFVRELGIPVVPLRINFGTESFLDGVELTTDAFMERLIRSEALPTTSQPTVDEFSSIFQEELGKDREIVCVTIGARLSGTHDAALKAAQHFAPDRIAVVDGGSTTMQLGWVVIEAARAASAGASQTEVMSIAQNTIARTKVFAVLKTLDYVYKGGRIGRVSQLVGSALAIKPIISFRNGTLVPIERVRTWKRALNRIVQLVGDEGDLSDIIVLYNDNRADADAVRAEIQQSQPGANVILGRAGAVISTHAGPGAIGVATLRRPQA